MLAHTLWWGSRPARTVVTTRWRGGKGGTCGARNRAPRTARNARPDRAQGLAPPTLRVPAVGRSAQAMTLSKVVLPAPDGPMMATCSPLATDSVSACRAGVAPGLAVKCRALTPFRSSFMSKLA